ncbi:sugar transferase [Glutamicibacter uratoxydans]|uniref:sugar transferase n=1 Tax=Glutamicibacter uratoxydans TaxID=43667 RepID=UPI003D6E7CA4
MSQAYETLGSARFGGKVNDKATGTWEHILETPQSQRQEGFSANRWRQKFTRILVVSDLGLMLLAAGMVHVLYIPGTQEALLLTAAALTIWLVYLALLRSRAPQRIGVGAKEYKRVVDATFFAAGTVALGASVLNIAGTRELILVMFPAGLSLLLLGRWSCRRWLHVKSAQGYALSQVVVVGQAPDVSYVVRQLEKKASPAYRVSAVLFDGQPDQEIGHGEFPVFANLENLESSVNAVGADSVIVAGPLAGGSSALKDLSWRLEQTKTNVIVVSSLTNVAGPRISVRPVEGLPLMHVDIPNFSGGHHVVKRVIDVVLSSLALVALSPLFVVIALAVRRDSPGPIFFSQERVGRNGSSFRMYKFRSMVVNAEAELEKLKELNEGSGPLFKMKRDPRVTKVGQWLRKFSLDELPQIYNVLRGDMSLVGPRPPLPEEVATYQGHTSRRLFIKPGVTGLWQINGRSDLDWEESVRLDLYYVENWSLTGDIMIMWRTFRAMVQPEGAY